jgi:Raf kinase inhibitor-like YbhB/YbcL family protein
MHIRWSVTAACIPGIILAAMIMSAGCTSSSPPTSLQPASASFQPAQPAASSGTLTLSVDSLSPGSILPDVYTCKGTMESPKVAWSGIPAGTKSLVLILEDPDAPNGIFTHWLVYNIPPGSGELAQSQPNAKTLSNDAQQGQSSTGERGYKPPCPPVGSTHRYIFRLYALDIYPALPTADRAAIDQAMAGHTLAKTEFITTFKQ